MADFASHGTIEDWSLQAIVSGSSGDFTKIVGLEMEGRDSFFETYNRQKLDDDCDFLASFPELFDVSNGSSDELEDLYKPFYPVETYAPDHHSVVSQFQQNTTDMIDAAVEDDKKPSHESDQSSMAGNYVSSSRDGYAPKYKRRKNQHKRVVIQVSAEGLTSDMWAWRKYGQKPIKGSPYPRSYYRCSSLKGCLARKQVEQSFSEPGMFIVTYTADHSHSKPTRRNSLAGTVRQKFPSNKNNNIKREKVVEGSSSSRNVNNSPKAANNAQQQVTLNQEVDFNRARIKQEEQQGDDQRHELQRAASGFNYMAGSSNDDDDMMFINENFFSGLENFDDIISASSCHASAHQFQVRL